MCHLRAVPFSLPSNRLHRTDESALTNHRSAPAAVNTRAGCHSPGATKPRGYTSKADLPQCAPQHAGEWGCPWAPSHHGRPAFALWGPFGAGACALPMCRPVRTPRARRKHPPPHGRAMPPAPRRQRRRLRRRHRRRPSALGLSPHRARPYHTAQFCTIGPGCLLFTQIIMYTHAQPYIFMQESTHTNVITFEDACHHKLQCGTTNNAHHEQECHQSARHLTLMSLGGRGGDGIEVRMCREWIWAWLRLGLGLRVGVGVALVWVAAEV